LEQINYRLVLLGVSLLSFSLCVGASWWLRNTESVNLPKLVVTIGVWLAYLTILLLRWRGRLVSVRFAWVCVIMFCLALLSLGPVNSNRHGYRPVTLTPR
jgi:ABC-type uncharacterized transport system permease subunit